MIQNIGTTDRIIRAVVAFIIIVTGMILNSWWGIAGIAVLLTAMNGTSLIYIPFKISTIKEDDD